MSEIEKVARELLDALMQNDPNEDESWESMAMRELIAALTPPEGYVLVPVEPTREMTIAACKDHGFPNGDSGTFVRGYRSMLAARPEVN